MAPLCQCAESVVNYEDYRQILEEIKYDLADHEFTIRLSYKSYKGRTCISLYIKSIDPKLSVTMFSGKLDGEFAKPENSPWDVYVLSDPRAYSSCSGAKQVIYEIMRDIYTNNDTKVHIARLKINLSDQAVGSLGSKDAMSITNEMWQQNGPTTTTKALLASGSSELDSMPLDSRTYWETINGNCTP